MAETADVVVVGGGCLGTASALFLARKRAGRVLLLEQERVCSGITGRSSGIVRQSYVLPDNARLATKGLRVFEQFDRAIGGDAGFRNVGLVWVGGPEMRQTFDDLQQSMNEFGAESRYLAPEELRELAPGFRLEEGEFALWEPHGGYTSPPHAVAAYARQARLAGAEIRERTRVTGLRRAENGVFSLSTEQGTIETRVVVNATSGWSVKLLATLGVELPVKPYPVQVSHWLLPVETGPDLPVIGDWSNMAYLRPFPDRTLRLAGLLLAFSAWSLPAVCRPKDSAGELPERYRKWLTEDVVWAMPPLKTWYAGLESVVPFLTEFPLALGWRHIPTRANGQLAVGCYIWDAGAGSFRPEVIDVLTVRGGRIAEVTAFIDPRLFPRFGLPERLDD